MNNLDNLIPLESVKIASPCKADWNQMKGSSRVRHCVSCEKNVYNLSGMTRPEADSLIRSREGELCIRLARRADGTVITDDCPIGLRASRDAVRRAPRFWRYALVVILLPVAVLLSAVMREVDPIGLVFGLVTAPLAGPMLGSMTG